MKKTSQIEKNVKDAYFEEYPEGDFTKIANKITTLPLCREDPRKDYLRTYPLIPWKISENWSWNGCENISRTRMVRRLTTRSEGW